MTSLYPCAKASNSNWRIFHFSLCMLSYIDKTSHKDNQQIIIIKLFYSNITPTSLTNSTQFHSRGVLKFVLLAFFFLLMFHIFSFSSDTVIVIKIQNKISKHLFFYFEWKDLTSFCYHVFFCWWSRESCSCSGLSSVV